jgi:rSAM/selenodomain-associated transferase 2
MLVSIIIPCLNEASGIHFFLSQLQRFRSDCELILVDGGSNDKTVLIAESLVDHCIHSHPGRAIQMNAGADVAQAPVLMFLHADTFLPDDALSQIAYAIDSGHLWGRFDVRLMGDHILLPIISALMNCRSGLTHIATGDQTLFVDKALFYKVGRFPEISLMEDIALSKTLKGMAKPYRINSRVETSARRWMQFGVIKTVLLMWWCRLQYFFGIDPAYLQRLYLRGQFWIR